MWLPPDRKHFQHCGSLPSFLVIQMPQVNHYGAVSPFIMVYGFEWLQIESYHIHPSVADTFIQLMYVRFLCVVYSSSFTLLLCSFQMYEQTIIYPFSCWWYLDCSLFFNLLWIVAKNTVYTYLLVNITLIFGHVSSSKLARWKVSCSKHHSFSCSLPSIKWR